MAGRHSAQSSSSKKPIIILSIATIVVICAVIGLIIFLNNSEFSKTDATGLSQTTKSTALETNQTVSSNQSATKAQLTDSDNSDVNDDATTVSEEKETVDIVVPTNGGISKNKFNATYIPYKAVDLSTKSELPLREFFGSEYTDGVLTFNDDGTFSDTLSYSSANSGAYAVEDNTITVTYSNDKNLLITVNLWDNDTPSDFIVHYDECDVYFHN